MLFGFGLIARYRDHETVVLQALTEQYNPTVLVKVLQALQLLTAVTDLPPEQSSQHKDSLCRHTDSPR